ncbi:MAG TPA: hemolysin family protein [Rhabdochlamydiaceae bacterium]|nr:hemolysin family protein [Rhabdochlamydiaceae bacterium]
MRDSWQFFLFLTFMCIIIQGFFAMVEMAAVSFNKVRLQYYVSKENRRALWLSYLLNRPAQLFGTTLIGVNTALQLGSESSRKFYESLGISPEWAPLSQIFLVLIFAEITPMFAGRRYAEHTAMLGVPIIYFLSKILRPIIWLFDFLCHISNRLVGSPGPGGLYLSREELQKVLEEREEISPSGTSEFKEFNTIVSNIFTLKNKTAKELMLSLNAVKLVPSFCTVAEMRALLTSSYSPYLPIYHRTPENIVAIAYPRDLLRISENKRVREYARPPWFITEHNSILQILKQFRRNNQTVAVVLNEAGAAIGILTLDAIIDEIFGRSDYWEAFGDTAPEIRHVVVDRTFPGDMKISDFNRQFHVHLESDDVQTLEELVVKRLGHPPAKGETVRVDPFELTVEEVSILGIKQIAIRTIHH